MNDNEFYGILWRAFVAILTAFGKRYGFCERIEIVKK